MRDILIALLVGFFGGAALTWVHLSDERQAAVQKQKDQAALVSEQLKTQLRDALESLAAERSKIHPRVVQYVTTNPACDLTRGAVSVLNSARGVPDAGRLTDAEKSGASGVTQQAEIDYHADCAYAFRDLAERHDTLIEWIERTRN